MGSKDASFPRRGGSSGLTDRELYEAYVKSLQSQCTPAIMALLVQDTVARALAGDRHCRDILFKHCMRTPPQAVEVSTDNGSVAPAEELSDRELLQLARKVRVPLPDARPANPDVDLSVRGKMDPEHLLRGN